MSLAAFTEILTLVATVLLAWPALRLSFALKKMRDVGVAVDRKGQPRKLQRYAVKWRRGFARAMQGWNRWDHWCLCSGVGAAVLSAVLRLFV